MTKKKKYKKKCKGIVDILRLCVSKSNTAIYCNLVDDCNNKIIAHLSSKDLNNGKKNCNKHDSMLVGKKIGEKIINLGMKKVLFDRNGYLFHGKVKAVAEGLNCVGVSF